MLEVPFILPWQLYWFLQYLHWDFGFLGSPQANLMKCFHTIVGSLPYCLRGNGGSDAPSPISAASYGGLEEGRLGVGGSLGAPNPSGAHSSNKKKIQPTKN